MEVWVLVAIDLELSRYLVMALVRAFISQARNHNQNLSISPAHCQDWSHCPVLSHIYQNR
jgi:hypothetical protein